MPQVKVVLVEPRVDGNVGAVARSMANFGFTELCMVKPCELTDEAFKRAKHAGYILREAQVVSSFEEAIADCFHVVGTSGIVTAGEKHYIRIPLTPKEFAERLDDVEDKVAVVFGPEDTGLRQEELARCDLLVSIPSHEDYPVLNLSHAATIVLYELYQKQIHVVLRRRRASTSGRSCWSSSMICWTPSTIPISEGSAPQSCSGG
jgi:TrmH family RNA methyltransferase